MDTLNIHLYIGQFLLKRKRALTAQQIIEGHTEKRRRDGDMVVVGTLPLNLALDSEFFSREDYH